MSDDSVVVAPVIKLPAMKDRNPHALYCPPEDIVTVQADKDECDINKIIARVARGGDISHVNSRVARYGDFSDVPSYDTALNLVKRAEGFFMEMSPEVREKFDNDPGKMIAFMQDSKNYDEAVKLGLIVKKVETTPAKPAELVPPKGGTVPTPPPATPGEGK